MSEVGLGIPNRLQAGGLETHIDLRYAEPGYEVINIISAGLAIHLSPRTNYSMDVTGNFELEVLDQLVEERSADLIYEFTSDSETYYYLLRDGQSLVHIESATLTVICPNRKTVSELVKAYSRCWDSSEGQQEGVIQIQVSHNKSRHGSSESRMIQAPSLTSIIHNYPAKTRGELERLAALERPTGGRLIIFNGEPGTGKTFAIRALMQAWKDWCTFKVVMDPGAFFGDPAYMLSQLDRTKSKERKAKQQFQLFVLDDADSFLAADSKQNKGDAVARLLNLSDGILGQGLDCLFLISTNQEIREISEAMSRPGRCLAQVNFHRFSAEEAQTWLAAHDGDTAKLSNRKTSAGFSTSSSHTLAELYEALRE